MGCVSWPSRMFLRAVAGGKRRKPSAWTVRRFATGYTVYNEAGIEGLADRPRSGRPACLTKAEQAEVESWVERGADLATDGVVRFRRCDLRDRIASRFGVYLHERSVGKLLRQLNFRRLSVRPLHPKTDFAAQEIFKKRARIGGPPVAVETGCAILVRRGAAEKFLVDLTP